LLDLTAHPDVKFVRAHWEVARWGRGTETPMFEFGVRLKEIPADVLREVSAVVSDQWSVSLDFLRVFAGYLLLCFFHPLY
jgi:hypothetical protein